MQGEHGGRSSVGAPVHRAVDVMCVVGILGFLGATAVYANQRRMRPAIDPFTAPQYWVDYRAGFVRRGLPGALLSILGGPSYRTVAIAGTALTFLAVVGVIAMGIRFCRSGTPPYSRIAFTLLLISPLTISTLIRDIGRYDAWGYICIAFVSLVSVPSERNRRRVLLVVIMLGLASVAASEELLMLFVAPATFLLLREGSVRGRAAVLVWMPSLLVLAASVLARPSQGFLLATEARAVANYSPISHPNSIAFLGYGFRQETDFLLANDKSVLFASLLLCLLFYLVSANLLCVLVDLNVWAAGRAALTSYFAAMATLLCFVGVDYRRWWALALVGFLGATMRIRERHPVVAPRPSWVVPVAMAMVVLSLLVQNVPLSAPSWSLHTLVRY